MRKGKFLFLDIVMDEHSIEAVFSRAVADTYHQFLEAFNLVDESAPSVPATQAERSYADKIRTDLAA